ncbi:MAG: PEP-CTERM sorting domain-containing protein [Chthoniobacterales bacterium]|nr:PEP-CTERM sorting domain-containing protein [Chthoniobacterales bacterium]
MSTTTVPAVSMTRRTSGCSPISRPPFSRVSRSPTRWFTGSTSATPRARPSARSDWLGNLACSPTITSSWPPRVQMQSLFSRIPVQALSPSRAHGALRRCSSVRRVTFAGTDGRKFRKMLCHLRNFFLVWACLLLGAVSSRAELIVMNPTYVNRIISYVWYPFEDTVFLNDYFSTHYNPAPNYNYQRSMIYTPGSDFENALVGALGANYTINSVQLIVGSSTNVDSYGPYISLGAKGAYEVLTAYNPATVTWNNFNYGGAAGTNWASSPISTGTISGDTVVWDFSPSLIQGWIDGGTNLGLMFPDYGASGDIQDTTQASNVYWSINATAAVPEPATWAASSLLALTAGFVRWRRRARVS